MAVWLFCRACEMFDVSSFNERGMRGFRKVKIGTVGLFVLLIII